MIRCAICFEDELELKLLSAQMKQVTITPDAKPAWHFKVLLRCPHGEERLHVVYPASRDWEWAMAHLNSERGTGAH
jgi:hypothetical protein